MHAVVRGERLLGVPSASSPAKRDNDTAPKMDIEEGDEDDEDDNPSELNLISGGTINRAFAALLVLSLFMNIPMSVATLPTRC